MENHPDTTIFERACVRIPGGVNSPVRAFHSVGGTPVMAASAAGSRITTEDGRELIDFCGSWGPLILGHTHPKVVEAVSDAARRGLSFGIATAAEVEMAERLSAMVPYLEMTRLVNSGTEATMTALRLARAATDRPCVLKFEGCYHGHSDAFLIAAGSGLLTAGAASSAGVTAGVVADTLVGAYNDAGGVRRIVAERGDHLAAIIVEPVAGNMGMVPPQPGFLETLREVATECGALLIFDEVISGFRLGPTTYGARIGITPDLTTLGKIIGGGMPIGAVGGSRELMELLAPIGPVYQAGTLSGNPVAVAAGLTTLAVLEEDPPYAAMEERARRLSDRVNDLCRDAAVPAHASALGGMFTVFFRAEPVHNLADAKDCDTDAFARFFHTLLDGGVYMPPSQFETAFVSAAHSDEDIDAFIDVATVALR